MQTFKKIISSVLIFLIITMLISTAAIYSFFDLSINKNSELNERNKISGKIETLFVGSSKGLCAFVPEIVNAEMDTISYNLCGSAMSPNGIYALLNEEIDRNPLKTIIIDVGDDTLSYKKAESNSEGEIDLIPRIRNYRKRINYFFNNVNVKDYPLFYAKYLNNGVSAIKDYLLNSNDKINYTFGFNPRSSNNMCLSDEEIVELFKSEQYNTGNQENYGKLSKLIQLCKSKNINVILVSLPVSNRSLWEHANCNELYNKLKELSVINSATYIDFNLLKNKNSYFSDTESFHDNIHFSEIGAREYTKLLCDILEKINSGEDVSDMFYSSYDEAIKHMDYYKTYQKLIKEQSDG